MYLPSHFAETRPEVLHQLISEHPLATLVSMEADGLCANHIPFIVCPPDRQHPHGLLRGHVARANPVWQNRDQVLLVFQGASHYISPSWYPEKRQNGAVVPTYNYMVVQARGHMRSIEDPASLLQLLRQLTSHFEQGRAAPWQVDDAPADYLANMMAMIVGIEIPIEQISGKWKTSQNRTTQTRAEVALGLSQESSQAAHQMAAVIEQQMFDRPD